MKYSNVKFTAIATYSDGSMSNWANKQYDKDNGVTVTVWEGYTDKVYCTYHA